MLHVTANDAAEPLRLQAEQSMSAPHQYPGAGYYHQAIKQNNAHISAALDHIPLKGLVSKEQYNAYIHEFVKAFPSGGDGVVALT